MFKYFGAEASVYLQNVFIRNVLNRIQKPKMIIHDIPTRIKQNFTWNNSLTYVLESIKDTITSIFGNN